MESVKRFEEAGPFHRFVRRGAATRPMSRLFGSIQNPLDRFVYRLTRGRATATSWLSGAKVTMLTTTGARTGQVRRLPVLGLPDGDSMILIASNFGRSRNPSWYYNLRANPRATIEFDRKVREVIARELSGEERERCYQRAVEIAPHFTRYPIWAGDRRIPVLRLEPPEPRTA
jgi:deazaflavin-dependent oxidoreductase (nitroreductase family)